MARKHQDLLALVTIVGGFLTMAGIVLLGIAALGAIGYLNVGVLLENRYVFMFAVGALIVGLLDTFSAIIIARW